MAEPFKNLFNIESTEIFADLILKEYKTFKKEEFLTSIFTDKFYELELKKRMDYITRILNKFLPSDYKKTIEILMAASKGQKGFFYMVLPHYVELYGQNDFDISVIALEEFTKLCSSEFAVRPFVIKYEDKMLKVMEQWSKSPFEDVRRLASEGSRPILPWAMDITFLRKNPDCLINILNNLVEDNSEYVRKSVANNLNSISKDNPDFVLQFSKKWYGKTKNTDKIIKHGLRTLLKRGDKKALDIIGYHNNEYLVNNFILDDEVKLGENLNFSFNLFSDKTLGKIRIEYIIHLLRQNMKYNKKIFKISEVIDDSLLRQVKKSHSFRPVTTRKYYAGRHFLTIVVNGKELETKEFILKE